MTASKTANLGLMNPVGSDAFTTTDFASTFQTLDTVPGVLVVPNQASRPTGWSASQHGRMVWQADLNAMWIWVQPSSGTAGSWSRQGNVGFLGGNRNGGTVNTTAITVASAPNLVSVTVMIPGGRPVLIFYDWIFIGNSTARAATLNLIANSVNIWETRHPGVTWDKAYTPDNTYPPGSGLSYYYRPANSVAESVTFQLRLRCQDPASAGNQAGGGTSSISNCGLNIFEV